MLQFGAQFDAGGALDCLPLLVPHVQRRTARARGARSANVQTKHVVVAVVIPVWERILNCIQREKKTCGFVKQMVVPCSTQFEK